MNEPRPNLFPASEIRQLPAPLLTPKQLCVQLSICYRTYCRLVRAGLPCVFVLTARRYVYADVLAWLRARMVPAAEPVRHRVRPIADDPMVRHLKQLARGKR